MQCCLLPCASKELGMIYLDIAMAGDQVVGWMLMEYECCKLLLLPLNEG